MHLLLASATLPDSITFAIAAAICVIGALGVVLSTHPVHSALCLVMTLFGVAVLFIEENAQFLAAVQVIVYAGAIVVLFLFVIMLLGVDRTESMTRDPLKGQRLVAILLGLLALAEVVILGHGNWPTGARSASGALVKGSTPNVNVLGTSIFTTYLLPFEITSALLVIAVIGAVVLARHPRKGGELGPAAADSPPAREPVDGAGPGAALTGESAESAATSDQDASGSASEPATAPAAQPDTTGARP